jgi:hypothetical protein
MAGRLLAAVRALGDYFGRRDINLPAARARLENARADFAAIRALHRAALEELMREPDAVAVLARRETYRHLVRAAECLADTLPAVEDRRP